MRATRDPAPEVVAEAANTLKYYPSRRTLRCLHGLRSHACEQVRRQAIESFEDVRQGIAVHLRSQDQRGAGRVRKWLQPVWDLLDFSEEELSAKEEGPPHPTAAETPDALPLSDLLELLASPETSPRSLRERLLADTWERYDEPGRRLLRPVLLNHPDQFVRDQAAQAFVAWHDAEALVALLGDSDFVVRKSAMYFLSTLPPSRGVGELAWGHLSRSDVVGIHATETLGTFVKHAEPVVAVTQLAALAGDRGQREELRTAAVRHLCRLGARHELEQLLDLLREPPVITWALQLAVLGAIVELELLLPDVSHLQEVDNLYIQVALADAGAGSPWA